MGGLAFALMGPVRAAVTTARLILASGLVLLCACTTSLGGGAFSDHDEASDFDEARGGDKSDGVSPSFNRHNVMSDDFFTAAQAMDGDDLQRFFEDSPYDDSRSWLADATVNGKRAADAIVEASQAHGINPLVMVARMQVEKSLVSKTVAPSGHSVDFAFGCGCHDGQSCSSQFRGLDKQVDCAANTLRTWFDESQAGTGEWRKGHSGRTNDPLRVTPENHATASLYSYTPWVLVGRGGNWLVWNITRKFERHATALGVLATGPDAPLAATWERLADGSYDFFASATAEIDRVVYYVDDIPITEAQRADGDDFRAHRVFNSEGPDRPFEVRGYDSHGSWIAMGNGRLDVSDREGVYLRQTDAGEYEVGLERAGSDVAAIEVSVGGTPLSDLDTGSQHSTRLAVRGSLEALGPTTVEVRLFDASGVDVRGYDRDLIAR